LAKPKEKPKGWFATGKNTDYWVYHVRFGKRARQVTTDAKASGPKPVGKWKHYYKQCEATNVTIVGIETESAEKTAKLLNLKTRTFGALKALYWTRKGELKRARDLADGKKYSDADSLEASLDWLEAAIGTDFDLCEINDDLVAGLVDKRSKEPNKKFKTVVKLISNRTVNHSMTDVLQKLCVYARDVCKVPMQIIDWKLHRLPEASGNPRELSQVEEPMLLEAARADMEDLHQFEILCGARRGEVLAMKVGSVNLGSRQLSAKGKTGERIIPISDDMAAILTRVFRQPGFDLHPEAPLWTFVAARTQTFWRGKGENRERVRYVKGERYPLTDQVIRNEMARIAKATGIKGYSFHKHRHTAGSRITRASGIHIAAKVLGHGKNGENIEVTRKFYGHISGDDVLVAMNRAAEQSTFSKASLESAKTMAAKMESDMESDTTSELKKA